MKFTYKQRIQLYPKYTTSSIRLKVSISDKDTPLQVCERICKLFS